MNKNFYLTKIRKIFSIKKLFCWKILLKFPNFYASNIATFTSHIEIPFKSFRDETPYRGCVLYLPFPYFDIQLLAGYPEEMFLLEQLCWRGESTGGSLKHTTTVNVVWSTSTPQFSSKMLKRLRKSGEKLPKDLFWQNWRILETLKLWKTWKANFGHFVNCPLGEKLSKDIFWQK